MIGRAPVSVELDLKALARFEKRVEQYRGLPLVKRMEKGTLDAARLLVGPVRTAAPRGPTGNLKRSISARPGSRGASRNLSAFAAASQGAIAGAVVGPRSSIAPHRHLVIRGHEIVGHLPNKVHTGKRAVANPFVDEAVRPRAADALRVIRDAIARVNAP